MGNPYWQEAAMGDKAYARAYALRGGKPNTEDTLRNWGVDPSAERSTFLPRRDAQGGVTLPEILYGPLRAIASAGSADVSPEEALNAAGMAMGGASTAAPVGGAVAGMAQRPKYGSLGYLIDKYRALAELSQSPKSTYGSPSQLIDKYRMLAGAKIAEKAAPRAGSFLSTGEKFTPPDNPHLDAMREEMLERRRTRAFIEQLRAGGKRGPLPFGQQGRRYPESSEDLRVTPPERAGIAPTNEDREWMAQRKEHAKGPTFEELRAHDEAVDARIRGNSAKQSKKYRDRKKERSE